MVNAPLRFTLTLFSAIFFAAAAPAKDLAEYRIGDPVTEDIITPVPLMVVDPVATAALKAKEAQRVPVILRFNTAAAPAAEAGLDEAWLLARSNFLELRQLNFPPTRLTPEELTTGQLQKLITAFKRRDKSFPLTVDIAGTWVRGDSDEALRIALTTRLRAVMEQPIRYYNPTNTLKLTSQVRLVTVTNDDETISLDAVKQRGRNTARTNVMTMTQAREALAAGFSAEEAALVKYAGRWLRPNCFAETELTLAARTRHTDPLFVADNYSAGQVIARAGQTLDQKMMAALGQLQEKTAAGRLQQQVVQEKNVATEIRQRSKWLGVGLAATTLLLVAGWMLRRREPMSQVPARIAENLPAVTGGDAWQQRALVAEQQVEKTHAAVRAGALTQLARLFREKLVRGLISQRSELLDAQQSAAAEMAEMEKRLNDLHAPLQDRLRAYETRIADLESALAVKGEENRELIKAKIQLIRHQMEAERTRDRLEFN
jgi:hypothetical protein